MLVTDELLYLKDKATLISFLDPNPSGAPVVLLLHGLGADGSSWGYQVPALIQAGMRPVLPDIPGFGRSPFTARSWSIRKAAEVLASFVQELGASRLALVGISMGGTVALHLALEYPGLFSRLVLVNTFASLRPKRLSEWGYLVGRYALANLRGIAAQTEMVANRIFPDEEQYVLRQELVRQIMQADQQVYRRAMRCLGLFNVKNRLREISLPTLVISGEKDTTVNLQLQKELAAGIGGARHMIIPGGGHAIIADQPETFNRALIEFLLADLPIEA